MTGIVRAVALLVFAGVVETAAALDILNGYQSPRNPERKVRQSTELIVLHTTEAPERSSLNKVSDRGECHYVVTAAGRIYRIVDRDREAFHAGRSMWGGKEDVDKFSVGIECVGYHNQAMPKVQLAAIRELVKALQAMYRIPDSKVVAHSHVAYGAPNRWYKRKHRGRKRCGMLFAMPSVRRQLQLAERPKVDVDVRARRLMVADKYLNQVLYGRVDTMVAAYGQGGPSTSLAVKPVVKPRASVSKPSKPAVSSPIVAVKPASGVPKSVAELKARGFVARGQVSKTRTAISLAGARWNAADTYYSIRDKVIPGNQLDAKRIENGMTIWMRK